ncbi:ABC transporter substrate-binding protein [Microbacterium sp. CFBP 8794]|uniref:ABC transporter substrate-binding protein n=1 Tax=Microbacterium sp. CFBP 8794 TaxID=2775269 RepID=UPI00177B2895|nr:ABC transporter substrate-binding protein [Microbacterium sp. CFBP 8794]MBD8477182.1 carbohydrate ABC transporter substrate-binding protein [Microbacterium sp. CFBP 8794]
MATPLPAFRGRRPRRLLLSATATAAACGLLLTGCSSEDAGGGSEFGFVAAVQDPDSAITVWVDAAREPAAAAFQAANPDIEINVETYDGGADGSGSFQTKVSAFDQAGEGWPDVVFSTQNTDASWASQGETPFAAVLDKGFLDDKFLSGFTPGALDPLTVDGSLYGLRNDLAQNVLWYDQSLLDEFGYELPTTWEEYEALGEKVAAEHPGYIVGSVGDSWAPEVYFWGAKAPVNQVEGVNEISVDTTDERAVKMAGILDTLIDNGTVVQDSVFGSDFVSTYAGKVLLMPGPIWYSGAIFQNPDNLASAPGTIGAGLPLAWDGEDPVTGNVGGGTWFVSSHSKNLEASKAFVEFVTSDPAYQVELSPGYPAYASAGNAWLDKQAASGFFAGDFAADVRASSGLVWEGWGYPRFSQAAIWAKTVTPELAAGASLVDTLPAWQTAIENEAQVNGYTVAK